jgi:hypothetical protein
MRMREERVSALKQQRPSRSGQNKGPTFRDVHGALLVVKLHQVRRGEESASTSNASTAVSHQRRGGRMCASHFQDEGQQRARVHRHPVVRPDKELQVPNLAGFATADRREHHLEVKIGRKVPVSGEAGKVKPRKHPRIEREKHRQVP